MRSVTAKRFSLDEYHQLIELGFFTENNRIELIRGEMMQMAAKGTLHEVCITRLINELPKSLQVNDVIIRCQSPILLPPSSEPEPNFTIAKNRPDEYVESHPNPDDILLLIEVSDSSITYDQEVKLPLYAENEIPSYWIFNLLDRILECYSEPYQTSQETWTYRTKQIYQPTESVTVPVNSRPSLSLKKSFPPSR